MGAPCDSGPVSAATLLRGITIVSTRLVISNYRNEPSVRLGYAF